MAEIFGTNLADTLIGTSGADSIYGYFGNDVLKGEEGNDSLYGGDLDDELHGGAGDDLLVGGEGFDTLYADTGRDVLVGGSLSDTLIADGVDDELYGGDGDDRYVIANRFVTIVEEATSFSEDTVEAIGSDFELFYLPNLVERFVNSTGGSFTAVGNALANRFDGGAFGETFIGGEGNDSFFGSSGEANTLIGGLGNDIYNVELRGDTIVELAGEGNDRIFCTATVFFLPLEVEELIFTGPEAVPGTARTGFGNDQANRLTGWFGRDTLSAGGGNDRLSGGRDAANELIGGTGNDIYVVDVLGDTIVEFAGEGTDGVVITSLASFALPANVENLGYIGNEAFTGVGNELDNVLTASFNEDFLSGGSGNDTLSGGDGLDYLLGGTGADIFVTAANENFDFTADRVLDFESGVDKLKLLFFTDPSFTPTPTIALNQGNGPQTATTSDTTFLYNSGTGQLFLDVDGTGAQAPKLSWLLNPGLTLAVSDFTFG